MSLVQATFHNDSLWAFMTGFGEGVNDLRCTLADLNLKASVDTATHFFTKTIGIYNTDEDYRAGIIYIPDVHKVGAFLKACDEDTTSLRHVGNTLTLKNGNNELSMPTSDYIMSHTTVSRAESAITSAAKNKWVKLGRADLECHGMLTVGATRGMTALTKVVGKDAPVKVRVADGEMTITAGTNRGARMTRQCDVDTDYNGTCETVFGPHFPKLLNLMPSGPALFHMGNKSALVIVHAEVACTLVLKHQEGVDQ
jgi:hypothetical protein